MTDQDRNSPNEIPFSIWNTAIDPEQDQLSLKIENNELHVEKRMKRTREEKN
jgi:hypothetical protein